MNKNSKHCSGIFIVNFEQVYAGWEDDFVQFIYNDRQNNSWGMKDWHEKKGQYTLGLCKILH